MNKKAWLDYIRDNSPWTQKEVLEIQRLEKTATKQQAWQDRRNTHEG